MTNGHSDPCDLWHETQYARSQWQPVEDCPSPSPPSPASLPRITRTIVPSTSRTANVFSLTSTATPCSPLATYLVDFTPVPSMTSCPAFLRQTTLSPTRNGVFGTAALWFCFACRSRFRLLRDSSPFSFTAAMTWHSATGSNPCWRMMSSTLNILSIWSTGLAALTILRFSGSPSSGFGSNRCELSNVLPCRISWHAVTMRPELRRISVSSPAGTPAAMKSRSGAPWPTGGSWFGSPTNSTFAPVGTASRSDAIKPASIIDDSSTITNPNGSLFVALYSNSHWPPFIVRTLSSE